MSVPIQNIWYYVVYDMQLYLACLFSVSVLPSSLTFKYFCTAQTALGFLTTWGYLAMPIGTPHVWRPLSFSLKSIPQTLNNWGWMERQFRRYSRSHRRNLRNTSTPWNTKLLPLASRRLSNIRAFSDHTSKC